MNKSALTLLALAAAFSGVLVVTYSRVLSPPTDSMGGRPASGARVPARDASAASVDAAKHLRVFFGHQSVGNNILDGVREVAPELRIVRSDAPPESPAIVDTMIGRNGSPDSKLSHFTEIMAKMGNRVDVAMMKFCYVDFSADTNVDEVERKYRDTMNRLSAAHQNTRFLHVTVPLTVVQAGPKALVKRILRRPVWGEIENVKRADFNDWLRRAYPTDAIFDLAAVESRLPNGEPITYEYEGRRYPMLHAGYSYDGEHLAAEGRRMTAVALLNVLGRQRTELRP